MKTEKKPKPKIDLFDLYLHAYNVMDADRSIRGISPKHELHQGSLAIGAMILSSFSCELFLKLFIYLDNREPASQTHRLNVLYRQISHKHKRMIERAWDNDDFNGKAFVERINKSADRKYPSDLPNALVTCGEAFERLRYRYEKRHVPYYLQGLPFVLIAVLQELKPEWKYASPTTPATDQTR